MRDLNQYYWKYDDFRQKIRGIENRKLNTSYLLLYLCGITKEKSIAAFLRLLILKCVMDMAIISNDNG